MLGFLRSNPFRDGRRVIFCHAQKTGGTSLRTALAARVPARRVYPSAADSRRRGLSGNLATEAAAYAALPWARKSALWLIADHLPPCMFQDDPDDPLLVTMLREPVARALSHLAHARRYTPGLAGLSFAVLFEYPVVRAAVVDNFQVRFFSAQTAEQAADQLKPRDVGPADLARALAHFEKMHAVGLTEHFDASVRMIGATLGVPDIRSLRENVATERDREEAENPRLRRRIADAVGLDRDLYSAIKARAEAKLGVVPPPAAVAKAGS